MFFFKIYYRYYYPSHKFIHVSCRLHAPYLLFVDPINYFYICYNLVQLSSTLESLKFSSHLQ